MEEVGWIGDGVFAGVIQSLEGNLRSAAGQGQTALSSSLLAYPLFAEGQHVPCALGKLVIGFH